MKNFNVQKIKSFINNRKNIVIPLLSLLVILFVVNITNKLYKKSAQLKYDFIITVPHGICVNMQKIRVDLEDIRNCDKKAEEAANILINELKPYKTFFATHYRENTDLNREESRVTKFRTDIRTILKDCRSKRSNCLLIDVHSFPQGTITKDEEKEPDIYLIRSFYDNKIGEYLYNYLIKNDIMTLMFPGSPENDILLEATYFKVPSILIEFKESLSKSKLEKIIKVLSKGLKNIAQ
jgi:hypothetical protein